jgi:hypothetical protein
MTDTMRLCISLMQDAQIKRLIVVTAAGSGDSFPELPLFLRLVIKNTKMRYTYNDHTAQEALIKKSGLDWTIFRPMGLTNSQKIKSPIFTVHNTPKPTWWISRRHVAKIILDSIYQADTIGRCIILSEK